MAIEPFSLFFYNAERGWEHGIKVIHVALKFESKMMLTTNVVIMDHCIMDVMFLILLTQKIFIDEEDG